MGRRDQATERGGRARGLPRLAADVGPPATSPPYEAERRAEDKAWAAEVGPPATRPPATGSVDAGNGRVRCLAAPASELVLATTAASRTAAAMAMTGFRDMFDLLFLG